MRIETGARSLSRHASPAASRPVVFTGLSIFPGPTTVFERSGNLSNTNDIST